MVVAQVVVHKMIVVKQQEQLTLAVVEVEEVCLVQLVVAQVDLV